jgi:hypothetical protein
MDLSSKSTLDPVPHGLLLSFRIRAMSATVRTSSPLALTGTRRYAAGAILTTAASRGPGGSAETGAALGSCRSPSLTITSYLRTSGGPRPRRRRSGEPPRGGWRASRAGGPRTARPLDRRALVGCAHRGSPAERHRALQPSLAPGAAPQARHTRRRVRRSRPLGCGASSGIEGDTASCSTR